MTNDERSTKSEGQKEPPPHGPPPTLGFVQKQVPDKRRVSNKTSLTLTLSRPTGEGTATPVSRSFQSGWIRRPTEDDSPSPIRWERAGVRVPPNPKLYLHESLAP